MFGGLWERNCGKYGMKVGTQRVEDCYGFYGRVEDGVGGRRDRAGASRDVEDHMWR